LRISEFCPAKREGLVNLPEVYRLFIAKEVKKRPSVPESLEISQREVNQ